MSSTTAINPIIPGFSPDPSIVKVDGWFFLVNSSFHMFPGLPIYASQDLVRWKHIGNAIHRQSQLSLKQSRTLLVPQPNGDTMLASGGLFAPTIRHHNNTFYIVCTNVLRTLPGITQNFIVTTADIWAGKWSDPTPFDFRGIDPSLFFDDDDDDGRVYAHGSASPGPMTKIHLFEIDVRTGAKLSEERMIWGGSGGVYPEGPHLYRKDGWYYVVVSEGGTHENHMVTMARARVVWGPYEACPGNPILAAAGADEYVRFTGHCDLFQDGEGAWWGVCLGVRRDGRGRYILGRESFLTPARWDDEGWLSFEPVRLDPGGVSADRGYVALAAAPGVDWLYIRDADLAKYSFSDDGTSITVIGSTTDLSHPEESPSFVGKRQRLLNGRAKATLRIPPASASPSVKAGLAVYKEEHRYVRIFYDTRASAVVFEVFNGARNISRSETRSVGFGGEIDFRIDYAETEYSLWYTEKGGSGLDVRVATVDTLDLTDPDFVGPVVGVFVLGDEDGVMFDDVAID